MTEPVIVVGVPLCFVFGKLCGYCCWRFVVFLFVVNYVVNSLLAVNYLPLNSTTDLNSTSVTEPTKLIH